MIQLGNKLFKNICYNNKTRLELYYGNKNLIDVEGVGNGTEAQAMLVIPSLFETSISTNSNFINRDNIIMPKATSVLRVNLPRTKSNGAYTLKTKWVASLFGISLSTIGGESNTVDIRYKDYDSGLTRARMRLRITAGFLGNDTHYVDLYNGESTYVATFQVGGNTHNCYYFYMDHNRPNIIKVANSTTQEELFETQIEAPKPMYADVTFNYATSSVNDMSILVHRVTAVKTYNQVNS